MRMAPPEISCDRAAARGMVRMRGRRLQRRCGNVKNRSCEMAPEGDGDRTARDRWEYLARAYRLYLWSRRYGRDGRQPRRCGIVLPAGRLRARWTPQVAPCIHRAVRRLGQLVIVLFGRK